MLPTLDVGPLHLHTYSILAMLGALATVAVGAVRLHCHGYSFPCVTEAAAWIAVGGAVGAYLGHYASLLVRDLLVSGGRAWKSAPDLRANSGAAFLGALAASIAVAVFYCRLQRWPVGRSFDLGGIGAPLGQAIGRLGCFCAGCCYGRATDSWLGIYLPDLHGSWAVRYPTQLLSGLADLLIFLLLFGLDRYRTRATGKAEGWPFPGFLFLLYTGLYTAKRFSIEFLRAATTPLLGQLTLTHLACLIGLVASAALIAWNLRRPAQVVRPWSPRWLLGIWRRLGV